MSLDKLVDSEQLDSDLTSVADAIRAKSGGTSQLSFPDGFRSEINAIPRSYDDLSDKPQINGHTLTGNQSAADLGLGTYTKPIDGIPQSDLASDVQSQLFTSEDQTKLAGIEAGAEVNVIEQIRYFDPFRQQWRPYAITNKGVNLPDPTIPEEVHIVDYFSVTESGGSFSVTNNSDDTQSDIIGYAEDGEVVIAKVNYNNRVFYFSLVEAKDNDPFAVVFAGEIADGKFLRVYADPENYPLWAASLFEAGTYSKPVGGIPSSDLASAVQTSLGKADSAYQKPSGGIPETDLASSVQATLGQVATNTSGIGDLKSALDSTDDIVKYAEKVVISGASINPSGTIEVSGGTNPLTVIAFAVKPGATIGRITGTDLDCYAFYSSVPAIGSTSYNSSRTLASIIEDVVVPTGCNWIATRTRDVSSVSISPVSYLSGELNNLQNAVENTEAKTGLIVNYTEHRGYRTTTGSYGGVASYHSKTTDYIPCSEGDSFNYIGNSNSSAPSAIFYNSSKQVTGYYNGSEVVIPAGTSYVRFSSFAQAGEDIILDIYTDSWLALFDGNIKHTPQLYDGYIGAANGTASDNSYDGKYKRTSYIKIYKNIGIYLMCESHGTAGYAFYDGAKTFISGSGGFNSGYITIPDKAEYIRFTDYNASADHSNVYYKYYTKVGKDINELYGKTDITIQCIGDSVTAGIGTDGAYSADYGKDPYPAQLTTFLADNNYQHITVQNCGHPGERTVEIASRCGGLSCYFSEDITIPGDGTSASLGVAVESSQMITGTKLKVFYKDAQDTDYCILFRTSKIGVYPVYIDGVEYVLSVNSNPPENTIKKKTADGNDTVIKAGTLLFTTDNRCFRNVFNIIYGGLNDWRYLNLAEWIDIMGKCNAINGNKSIIIGSTHAIWENWNDLSGTSTEKYNQYRYKANEAFGAHFIDMRKEWFEHAMGYALDAGYFSDKTAEELASMEALLAQGIVPAEFTYNNTQNDVHLSKEGYYVFSKIIFNRLKMLNYI